MVSHLVLHLVLPLVLLWCNFQLGLGSCLLISAYIWHDRREIIRPREVALAAVTANGIALQWAPEPCKMVAFVWDGWSRCRLLPMLCHQRKWSIAIFWVAYIYMYIHIHISNIHTTLLTYASPLDVSSHVHILQHIFDLHIWALIWLTHLIYKSFENILFTNVNSMSCTHTEVHFTYTSHLHLSSI